jgi:prepilin-type N-terminal cleavage/methylation domain-containing protein
MRNKSKVIEGFTLLELLVVIAIIASIAALLLPVLRSAKAKAQRTVCVNGLHQIGLGVRMYSDDSGDVSPSRGSAGVTWTNIESLYAGYKALMKNYVGLKGTSSPQDKLFACSADVFNIGELLDDTAHRLEYVRKSMHDSPAFDYSSYAFNGGDNIARQAGEMSLMLPGLTNVRLSSVRHPDRTILLAEVSALMPYSWHAPSSHGVSYNNGLVYNDSRNVVSFVDGHVSYIKMFCTYRVPACLTNPPPGYDYQWTPD